MSATVFLARWRAFTTAELVALELGLLRLATAGDPDGLVGGLIRQLQAANPDSDRRAGE